MSLDRSEAFDRNALIVQLESMGQRVLHLKRAHRIVEIVADGMKRRLIHRSQERAL